MNGFVTKNKKNLKRFKFAAGRNKEKNRFKDENEQEEEEVEEEVVMEEEVGGGGQTELILTVEAQSEGYFNSRITEDTPVEFVHDFNLNNQVGGLHSSSITLSFNNSNPFAISCRSFKRVKFRSL